MAPLEYFIALWNRLNAAGPPHPTYQRLLRMYSQRHRAYHSSVHIFACIEEFQPARHLCEDPDAAEFALWFHDAVCDPGAANNEEESAYVAMQATVHAQLPPKFEQHVRELILATKHEAVPADIDAQVVVDVDLSIWGKAKAHFDDYETAVRKEYKSVPEEKFRAGRSAILKRFLARPHIYCTELFRRRYEARARKNLARSIALLDRPAKKPPLARG